MRRPRGAHAEAERRGELERATVKKIVDDMDTFDGHSVPHDEVADIVARLKKEDES